LRAVLSRCEAAWHDYQERRRRNRALASLETMDAHMLRDIGASESLIWRAVAREDEYQRRIANLCSGCSGRC
jgi:uncharacterized protein YjiS (DUF1127 family)